MNSLLTWKCRTIVVAAMLGASYGLCAAIMVSDPNLSLWSLSVEVICGAGLCASAGSMLCRFVETMRLIRESQTRTSDRSLCYRGIRYHVVPNDDCANEPQLDA